MVSFHLGGSRGRRHHDHARGDNSIHAMYTPLCTHRGKLAHSELYILINCFDFFYSNLWYFVPHVVVVTKQKELVEITRIRI